MRRSASARSPTHPVVGLSARQREGGDAGREEDGDDDGEGIEVARHDPVVDGNLREVRRE